MAKKLKSVFDAEVKGETVKLAVQRPNQELLQKAKLIWNKRFTDELRGGTLLREEIDKVMKERNLFTKDQLDELIRLQKEVAEKEKKLADGGIKESEGRKLAIELIDDRAAVRSLLSVRDSLDAYTAQSQADNDQFNFLVSECTVYNDSGNKYFSNVEDYTSRPPDDEIAMNAAREMAKFMYGVDEDVQKKLPEFKFLIEHKFVNDKLQLVDDDGNLVDERGRRINEDGFLVDDDGNRIDSEGNKLDKDGNYVGAGKPFLSDDEESTRTQRKRGRPPKES